MTSDDRRHRNRFGRALLWGGAVALVVMALALLPQGWLEPIRGLFGGEEAAGDAFSDAVARVDRALAEGAPVPVTRARWDAELRPRVQVRRLLSAGRMTGEEVRRAQVMLEEFGARERAEASEGSRAAVRELRDRRLAEAFPRLNPDAITRELEALRRQVEVAEFAGAAEAKAEAKAEAREPGAHAALAGEDCVGCHTQARPLPPGRRLDLAALWPRLDGDARLDPESFPLLLDGLEFEAHQRAVSAEERAQGGCLSCHRPHGAAGFEVTTAEREQNMGLWLNPYTGQGLVGAQVKVQNRQAAHRVPAGYPEHGYAVVVTARAVAPAGDRQLEPWSGPRLPEELRAEGRVLGRLFARRMVGPDGEPAGRDEAVDIAEDTRLQPGRFSDDMVLFLPPEGGGSDAAVELRATLYWLPDARRWEGAVEVDRVVRREVGGVSDNHP